LHCEFLTRVYRKALVSNFNIGPGDADYDNDTDRAELLIEHYHVPYIFQQFKPHLSAINEDEMDMVFNETKEIYENVITVPSSKVGEIAIMSRQYSDKPWIIEP